MSLPVSASESKPRKEDLLSRVKGFRGLWSFTPRERGSRVRWAGVLAIGEKQLRARAVCAWRRAESLPSERPKQGLLHKTGHLRVLKYREGSHPVPSTRWTRAGSEHPGIPPGSRPLTQTVARDQRRAALLSLSRARIYIYVHTSTETRTTNQRDRVGAFNIQKATCGFIKATSLRRAGASVHQS